MTKKGILLHLAHVNRVNEKNPFELEFIKTLRRAGVKIWQHLPVNPPGKHDSPYSAPSSFAGDINLLSPNLIVDYSNEDFEKWKTKNSDWVFDWALFNVLKLMNNNMLVVKASENVVRLLPPLNVTKKDIDLAVTILKKVCKRNIRSGKGAHQ